jgi:hypothetical protein
MTTSDFLRTLQAVPQRLRLPGLREFKRKPGFHPYRISYAIA